MGNVPATPRRPTYQPSFMELHAASVRTGTPPSKQQQRNWQGVQPRLGSEGLTFSQARKVSVSRSPADRPLTAN